MQRAVLIMVLGICPSALALTQVGPSTAVLNGERFGLSFEYGRTDADLTFDLDGGESTESFDFQTSYADLAVALTDRWDFYLRLGVSQAEADGFDGDGRPSWGMGTRITAFTRGTFSWGVLAQFTNLVSRYDTREEFLIDDVPTLLNTREELNLVEYLFATGPTWRHGRLTLYGGLLVRGLTGELEADAGMARDQFDLDGHWDAGGYVGGHVTLFKAGPLRGYGVARGDLTAEGRFTGDSTGWSVGLLLPFGGQW